MKGDVRVKNPLLHLFSSLFRAADAQSKKTVARFFVLFFCANAFSMSEPLIVGYLFNTIQTTGITEDTLPRVILLLALLLAITFLFWFFHGPARVMEQKNAFRIFKRKKEQLVSGVLHLPLSWHNDHHSGDTIDRIEKGTKALFDFSTDTFMVFENVFRFTIAFIILVYFNIHASYLVLCLVAGTFFFVVRFDKKLERLYSQVNAAENTVSAKVYDVIGNITSVVMLRLQKTSLGAISREIQKPYHIFSRWAKLNEVKWFLVSVAASCTQFLVVATYIIQAVYGGETILVGTVYLLYSYVHNIVGVFYNFAWLYSDIVQKRSKLRNAEALEEFFVRKAPERASVLTRSWKEITVEHASFSYKAAHEGGVKHHIRGVSMPIARGEKIAFIGESGGGKTTMLKLLRGLYPLESGTVTVGKKRCPHGMADIQASVSLVPQDPEIFNATIWENITAGVSHARRDVERMSAAALFTPVAQRLPHGFNSRINEKGVNLSGGERQRLALARGLLFSLDKEIVLLDEPTSSVDAKNERLIYENIFRLFEKKTVISTIHRLHLLPLFDTIYYFHHGEVRASGSFESLQKTSKEFRALWQRYTKTHTSS
jgi:ATP-binding cassette, subfamily B, bacterial